MDIGTAIKLIRKSKGLSQFELHQKCGLTVNAISQIETGITFPQKNSIESICQALEVPVSYLLFFAISEEDVPEEKRIAFNSLNNAIKTVLLDDLKKQSS